MDNATRSDPVITDLVYLLKKLTVLSYNFLGRDQRHSCALYQFPSYRSMRGLKPGIFFLEITSVGNYFVLSDWI